MRAQRAGHAVAGTAETLGVLGRVAIPTVAKGVIRRRPKVMAVAERRQVDRKAIRTMRRLRDRHGTDVVLMRVAGRRVAVVLRPGAVRTILSGAPEPYHPRTPEKTAALRHFQPDGLLISDSARRPARRSVNEAVLQPGARVHALAEPIARTVATELRMMRRAALDRGLLDWDTYAAAWWRIVRTVVLGRAARDDRRVTDDLDRLRDRANWAFLRRVDPALRQQCLSRIGHYLDRAEYGTLGDLLRRKAAAQGVDPAGQVPHWLFAFDAARIAAFRAAAVLAARPEHAAAAESAEPEEVRDRPYLRGCVAESLRLWPTTPLILRETTAETDWGGTPVPAGTTFAIFTPFFHRDPERLRWADDFVPRIWLDGTAEADPALVPFSSGPAVCPAENLVLFMTSSVLANLLQDLPAERVVMPRLAHGPLPATLNHYALRIPYGRRSPDR